jgi:hypothetical protein
MAKEGGRLSARCGWGPAFRLLTFRGLAWPFILPLTSRDDALGVTLMGPRDVWQHGMGAGVGAWRHSQPPLHPPLWRGQ